MLTYWVLVCRSPELYCLKKLAGRDRTRIMTADSTCMLIWDSILELTICLAMDRRVSEILTQIIKTAMAIRILTLLLSTTSLNRNCWSLGEIIPTRVQTRVTMIISMTSDRVTVPRI